MKITVGSSNDGFRRHVSDRQDSAFDKWDDSKALKCIDIDGSRMDALTERLGIVVPMDRGTKKKKDEVKDFTLYLNYAASNLREITGIEGDDERRIKEQLENLADEKKQRLADFLWTFRFNEPQRDFAARSGDQKQFDHDYKRLAPLVAVKIFELRNYFAHLDRRGNAALVCDRDLFVLLEGILRPMAEKECMGPNCQTSKLYQMHLMNLRGPRKPPQPLELRMYDLTRRGIMFLVCMALYKDDAEEFLSCFADMRIPNRRRDSLDGLSDEDIGKLGRKKPTKRAFLKAFTFFSYRRGRVSLDGEDPNFLNFANIIGYLNKVPRVSFDYLALADEKKLLADLASRSTESEENKICKYDLSKQIRAKERFVSLAAAWCEDFEVLPSLKFKRLDITPSLGRHRYLFGRENDNAIHLDRHYIIENGAIRFEWRRPTVHYGDIRIGHLRSCIGESEFRRLLFCALRKPAETNAMLDRYFVAYHKVLELMLNADSPGGLSIFANDELAEAVRIVSGLTKDEILDEPGRLAPYFPKNIWRFFVQWHGIPDDDDLKNELSCRISARINWCKDFLVRVKNFRTWEADNFWKPYDQRGPKGACPKGALVNPPRNCQVSSASCVARVIAYLDYHLSHERKFRQLSLGEQHSRPGRNDTHNYEYQLVQSAIGKYALDQTSAVGGRKNGREIKGTVAHLRPELDMALARLRDKVEILRSSRRREMGKVLDSARRKGLVGGYAYMDAKKSIDSRKLIDLAEAASRLLEDELSKESESLAAKAGDELKALCRKHGVRPGLPFETGELVKTILGIDYDRWSHAFDYEHGHPYVDRKLTDGEHVAAQIPLPNGIAERVIRAESRAFGGIVGANGVDWAAAFASLEDKNVALLGFYDASPLVGYIKSHANHTEELLDPSAPGINTWVDADQRTMRPDFSRGGINKAIRAIKTAHNQDRLLLKFALRYWEEFKKTRAYDERRTAYDNALTVRDYFNCKLPCPISGGITLLLSRNDVFSHTLAHVCKNGSKIVKLLEAEHPGEKQFLFYDVAQLFARKQRESRWLRMEILPTLERFAAKCPIPQEEYARIDTQGGKEDERRKARRAMEYYHYSKAFPALTEEDYNLIADMRNAVMHSTLLVTDDDAYRKAKAVLDRVLRVR
ncbi:MAG: hypothetical protein IJG13_10630 [Kiritimatiellae bacterium]|nr:hypothetical protein [Kiritimatiellia bacterium]